MELLDRETFLEWMERIMKRFDDLKQTAPDIPQRPMIDGEPLLDNQEVCLMLQISKRTLQRYRASGTLPFLYANPLYGEPQTQEEETAQRYVISDCTQQQSPRFVVMTSRGLPFECDDNITDYIFGLTTNTFSARDGGSPSIEGCVAEILCPLLSNGLSG